MDGDMQGEQEMLVEKDTSNAQNDKQKKSTFKQFLLLGSLTLMRFLENFCGSLPSPFFARVMEDKGGTVFQAAVAVQVRMISYVLLSPVFGKHHARIGTKRLLYLGVFGSAISQLIFGLLAFVDDHIWFFIGTMLTRLTYGAVKAALIVAMNVTALQEYPDRISLIFGVFQAAAGSGYLLGPGLGGILYDQFGMAVPVLGSAMILLLCSIFPCCLIETVTHKQDAADSDISLKSILSKPLVIATLLLASSAFGILGYADVALTLYFEDGGLSTSLAGFALMLWGASFACMAPIIGYCASKNSCIRRFSVSIAAFLYSGIMFAFIPNQFLWVLYVSCAALGITCSVTNVPSLEILLVIANNGALDGKSNPALYGTITGVWQSAIGLGLLVFPMFATLIQSEISASFTQIFYGLSILNFAIALVQFILSIAIPPPKNNGTS